MSQTGLIEGYLAYYSALAAERRELRGATVLHTPGSPLLGANAAYIREQGADEEGLARAALWLHARGAAPLFAASTPLTGETVARMQVGRYRASGAPPADLQVEQVSRQQLAALSGVLAVAWNLPDWAGALNLSLGRALEGQSGVTWLAAYRAGQMVGALLLIGGAAHLWGVTDPAALLPLLDAAADLLGGELVTSTTEPHPVRLLDAADLYFNLGTVVQSEGGYLN